LLNGKRKRESYSDKSKWLSHSRKEGSVIIKKKRKKGVPKKKGGFSIRAVRYSVAARTKKRNADMSKRRGGNCRESVDIKLLISSVRKRVLTGRFQSLSKGRGRRKRER